MTGNTVAEKCREFKKRAEESECRAGESRSALESEGNGDAHDQTRSAEEEGQGSVLQRSLSRFLPVRKELFVALVS